MSGRLHFHKIIMEHFYHRQDISIHKTSLSKPPHPPNYSSMNQTTKARYDTCRVNLFQYKRHTQRISRQPERQNLSWEAAQASWLSGRMKVFQAATHAVCALHDNYEGPWLVARPNWSYQSHKVSFNRNGSVMCRVWFFCVMDWVVYQPTSVVNPTTNVKYIKRRWLEIKKRHSEAPTPWWNHSAHNLLIVCLFTVDFITCLHLWGYLSVLRPACITRPPIRVLL